MLAETHLRVAEPGDEQALADIDKLCFDDPWSLDSFKRELYDNPVALYLVTEYEGQIIGYVGLWIIQGEGHITNVAVHPDFRGEGVAKVMIMVLYKQFDIQELTLEVRVSNTPAIKLYESLGFVCEGIRPKYYENNHEDAMIMWRHGEVKE